LEGDTHQVAKTVEGPFALDFLDADKDNEVDYFQTKRPSQKLLCFPH
jgi:predicted O-methyltransferase YrrM